MIYSHIRLFIAGVEMPWSGNLTVTGGMMTTSLTFNLSDKEAYLASPLARTRFEDIPVKVAGLPPDRTLAEDESALRKNDHITDDDYVVLFDGAASLMMTYDPKSHRLDMNLRAVPGTVKALSSIVYSNLSIGSYTQTVENAADAVVMRESAEYSGNKAVATGTSTVGGMNSDLFLKKLAAGEHCADIDRPTDLIEYAIDNILSYAQSSMGESASHYTFISDKDSLNWASYGNWPDGLTTAYQEMKPYESSESGGDETPAIPAGDRTLRLPEILLRRIAAADLIPASTILDSVVQSKTGNFDAAQVESEAMIQYFNNQESAKAWGAAFFPFKFLLPGKKDNKTLVEVSGGLLPPFMLTELQAVAGKYEDRLAATKGDQMLLDSYQAIRNPETAVYVNLGLKVFLAVIGLYSAQVSFMERRVNLLDLLYKPDSKDWARGLADTLQSAVKNKIPDLYQLMISQLEELYKNLAWETLTVDEIRSDMESKAQEAAKVLADQRRQIASQMARTVQGSQYYLSVLGDIASEQEARSVVTNSQVIQRYLVKNNLTEAQVKALADIGTPYPTDAGIYPSEVQVSKKDNLTSVWDLCLRKSILGFTRLAEGVVKTVKRVAQSAYSVVLADAASWDLFTASTETEKVEVLHLRNIVEDLRTISKVLSKLDGKKLENSAVESTKEPGIFDIKAAKAIIDYSVYNKTGAPGYLRLGRKDSDGTKKYVYPHLAFSQLKEFQALVSSTALDNSNGACNLYTLLAALYSRLKLGLYTPLNKPFARQESKQIRVRKLTTDDLGAIDGAHSVLEMMLMPVAELAAVPKCNVLVRDAYRQKTTTYASQMNVSNILVRYTPPVEELTMTPAAGSVPPQYFRFDLDNPSGLKPLDKDWYVHTKLYSYTDEEGSLRQSWKNGHIYDMYKTAVVDVSSEIAAMAELVRANIVDTPKDEKERRAGLLGVATAFTSPVEDVEKALSSNPIYADNMSKYARKLVISASVTGSDTDNREAVNKYIGYVINGSGGAVYVPGATSTQEDQIRKSAEAWKEYAETYQELYAAACAQIAVALLLPNGQRDDDYKTGERARLTSDFVGEGSTFQRWATTKLQKAGLNPLDSDTILLEYRRKIIEYWERYMTIMTVRPEFGAGVLGVTKGSRPWDMDIVLTVIPGKGVGYGFFDEFVGSSLLSASQNQLTAFFNVPCIREALAKKTNYLLQEQEKTDGVGQISSASYTAVVSGTNHSFVQFKNSLPYPGNNGRKATGTADEIFGNPDKCIRFLCDNLENAKKAAENYESPSDAENLFMAYMNNKDHQMPVALKPRTFDNPYKDVLQPLYTETLRGVMRQTSLLVETDVVVYEGIDQTLGQTAPAVDDAVLQNIAVSFFTADTKEGTLTVNISRQTANQAAKKADIYDINAALDQIFTEGQYERSVEVKGLLADLSWLGSDFEGKWISMREAFNGEESQYRYLHNKNEKLTFTDPLWSYLCDRKAFIRVVRPEESQSYSALVTPYYYTVAKDAETTYAKSGLPALGTPVFALTDPNSVDTFSKRNLGALGNEPWKDRNNSGSFVITHSENFYPGTSDIAAGDEMKDHDYYGYDDQYRRKAKIAGKTEVTVKTSEGSIGLGGYHELRYFDRSLTKYDLSASYGRFTSYPFIVWFAGGKKATVVMLDLTTGGHSNFLTLSWFFDSKTLGDQIYKYFDLSNGKGSPQPNWAPGTTAFKQLWEHICTKNPFDNSSLTFDEDAYVFEPVTVKYTGTYGDIACLEYLAALQLPFALLADYITNDPFKNGIYNDALYQIDPRYDLAEYIKKRMAALPKPTDVKPTSPERPAVTDDKTKVVTAGKEGETQENNSTSAARLSGTEAINSKKDLINFMFQGQLHTGINVRSNDLTRSGGGKTLFCSNQRLECQVLSGPGIAYGGMDEVRWDGGEKFHIHGGVDFSCGATGEKLWAENPKKIPWAIYLPGGDHKVVYRMEWKTFSDYTGNGKKNNKIFNGFGFHAFVFPAEKPKTGESCVIFHVGHLNPAATMTNNATAWAKFRQSLKQTDAEISKKLEELISIGSESSFKSWAYKSDTYFFSRTKMEQVRGNNDTGPFTQAQLDTAFDYDDRCYALFDKTYGLLARKIMDAKENQSIGVMGQSGSGSGPHYHCDCWVLDPKKHPDLYKLLLRLYDKKDTQICQHLTDPSYLAKYRKARHIPMPNENSMLAFTMSREDALSFPKVTGAVAALKEDLEEVYGRRDIMNVGCTLRVSGKPPVYTDYPETMNSSESIPTSSPSVYKAPQPITISVAESRAYQEAIARLCTVQIEPTVLPYYDPYVMDGGMPAAVVYRNDLILTKVVSCTVTAQPAGTCQTSIAYSPGISVSSALPIYLRAMLSLADRSGSDARYAEVLDSVVFPFHCIDFFNTYPHNKLYMEQNDYVQMFGKQNFVFDWRQITSVVVRGNQVYPVVNAVANPSLLRQIVNEYNYSWNEENVKIDFSALGADSEFPMNEDSLLLGFRAWNKANLFTYSRSLTDSYNLHSDKDPQKLYTSGMGATYENIAVKDMMTTSPEALTPAELKKTYYDWHNLFLELRKTIKTQRPLH